LSVEEAAKVGPLNGEFKSADRRLSMETSTREGTTSATKGAGVDTPTSSRYKGRSAVCDAPDAA
jgi:hypothetical protein